MRNFVHGLARTRELTGLWQPFVVRSRQFWGICAKHWPLILELVKRDLKGGHAGHGLGSVWVYAQPLIVVGTFMLIFGLVLGTRINHTASFPGDYTSYILVGLVPWLITANALGRAPSVFTSNANLVKQVIFPIETLPVASTIACFITYVPSFVLLLCYQIWMNGLPLLALLTPIVVLVHALLIMGLVLALSVVTPFLRDIRELVTIYAAVSLYLTPAIYLPDWVPQALRPLLYLNPFSYVVWVYQDILFFGRIDHGLAWIVMALMTLMVFGIGLLVFRKAKAMLGNVL